MKLKVESIGDATGVILPQELVDRLNLEQGGSVLVAELDDGGLHLMPNDAGVQQAMSVVEEVLDEYQDTLRALKK